MPRLKAIAACLLAEYPTMPVAAARPASEIRLMMWPRPLGRILSIAASVPFMVPTAFTSSIRRWTSIGCSWARPVIRIPALLTQTSREPLRSTT